MRDGSMEVLAPLAAVSSRQGLDPLADRLLDLRAWLAQDMAEVDRALAPNVRSAEGRPGDLAERAASYLLARPGKRIRPLCVVLAARLADSPGKNGVNDRAVHDLAAACELVHAATLLHDDVIDEGTERRGVPAARVVYGNSASVLAGDHLLVEALRGVRRTGMSSLLDGLLDVIARMVEAEAMQLEQRGRFEPARATYEAIVDGKTAALFRWGLRAGGTVAGLGEEALGRLDGVGRQFGMAFQLVDDVLDFEGDPETTGKATLTDLREGKLTWPLIIACEVDDTLLADLRAVLPNGADLPELSARVEATGALQATRRTAQDRAEAACAHLRALPDGPARRAIQAVVEAAVVRTR